MIQSFYNKIICIITFVCVTTQLYNQTIYDSLCDSVKLNQQLDAGQIDSFIETMNKQNLDSMLIQNETLLCQSKRADYKFGIVEALNNLGYYHYAKHEVSKSGFYLSEALEISHSNDLKEGMASAHCYYGLLNEQIQNYENALIHYKKVYDLGVQENNLRWHGDGLVNIGKIHLLGKNYVDAEKYFLEAIEVFKPLGDISSLGWAYTHLGKLYANINQIDKAHIHIKKGYDIMLKNDNKRWMCYLINEFGTLYQESDPEKSVEYFREALLFNRDNPFPEQNILSLYNIGLYHFDKGEKNEARQKFKETYDKSEKYNDLTYLEQSTKKLAEIYAEENNFQQSNKFFRLNETYKNRLIDKREKESHSWLTAERKILKFEKKNNLLNAQNAAIAKDIEYQKNINVLLILATLLFTLLLTSLAFAYKNKRKHNATLNKTNSELLESLKTINKQSEEIVQNNQLLEEQKQSLINDLKSKLLILSEKQSMLIFMSKTISNMDLDTSSKRELLKLLSSDHNKNILEEIDEEFLNKNQDFFNKLSSKHPTLTANNLKLCALLKMNLSSKDIANLLYMSTGSVKIARSRLRKKLNLSTGDATLVAYLNSIDLEN